MTGLTLLLTDEATREEWLEARKLGSSDAAAICGLNPYRTKHQVFLEKIGAAAPVEENEAMRWGNLLEPVIAEEFARRTELPIKKDNRLIQHPTLPFMTATIDYLVEENGQWGILEIKNRNLFAGADYEDDGAADDAHIQVAHQLACSGLSFAYVAALIGGNRLVYTRFERDADLIMKVEELEKSFWRLVETKTPPELQAGDNDLLASLYAESNGLEKAIPAESEDWAKAYLLNKQQAKHFEELADECAANLKNALSDYEFATVGKYRISWKTQTRAEYTVKATSFRKFDVKELKDKKNG